MKKGPPSHPHARLADKASVAEPHPPRRPVVAAGTWGRHPDLYVLTPSRHIVVFVSTYRVVTVGVLHSMSRGYGVECGCGSSDSLQSRRSERERACRPVEMHSAGGEQARGFHVGRRWVGLARRLHPLLLLTLGRRHQRRSRLHDRPTLGRQHRPRSRLHCRLTLTHRVSDYESEVHDE